MPVILRSVQQTNLLPVVFHLVMRTALMDLMSRLNNIHMTHRPELISEEWMHKLTLEQFKPTSAASGF